MFQTTNPHIMLGDCRDILGNPLYREAAPADISCFEVEQAMALTTTPTTTDARSHNP